LPITFSPKDSIIINYYQDWEVDPDAEHGECWTGKGTWRCINSHGILDERLQFREQRNGFLGLANVHEHKMD